MVVDVLMQLFERDLKKLMVEIELYREEENIWRIEQGISNTAGNLALHLVGNLNTYIGAVIGKTGYVRNRELEFSQKNIPKAELLKKVEDTLRVVTQSLSHITDTELENEYPLLVWKEKTSTAYMLIHLSTHLAYHLGQINYHRRLIDG
jgi:uncharacterized damage-inducible protein DinB